MLTEEETRVLNRILIFSIILGLVFLIAVILMIHGN